MAPFIPQVIKAWILELALEIAKAVVQAVSGVGTGLSVAEGGGKIIQQVQRS
ncbi:hypothetical protein [Leifsonia sp. 2MCAF36]|uniref:hypothetical protein n=1 Tax=Leifsonia sp. 2MCAF36 TaxID=3232988 RepID=UPI003F9EB883